MSTTTTTLARPHRSAALVGRRSLTRRDLQIALGVLWLLDGALQAQPFMFTRAFARQILAPVGQGQPGFVYGPVHLASTLFAANPVPWNAASAAIQVLLGLALIAGVGRVARYALAASIAWALAVWYAGEGLSGMASGHASLITGAPGSALLYGVLAAAAWPRPRGSDQAPASWLVYAWALLWIAGAGLQLLPGQDTGSELAGLLTGAAGDAPHWLGSLDTSVARWITGNGALAVSGVAAIFLLVGLGAVSRRTRTLSLAVGLVLTVVMWVMGQDLGLLYSGQATDPNSAPLIALMAVVLLARSRTAGPATKPGIT
jgi:hypothetical protein